MQMQQFVFCLLFLRPLPLFYTFSLNSLSFFWVTPESLTGVFAGSCAGLSERLWTASTPPSLRRSQSVAAFSDTPSHHPLFIPSSLSSSHHPSLPPGSLFYITAAWHWVTLQLSFVQSGPHSLRLPRKNSNLFYLQFMLLIFIRIKIVKNNWNKRRANTQIKVFILFY